jgi:transposase
MVTKREEILDGEHEQFIERVAAIDVAKDAGKVCVRVPQSGRGRRVSTVWDVRSTTNAVTELGVQLLDQGIEKITLESTSDYWRIWYYVLEAAGLDVQLVNARDVKNLPGRPKTDKLDAIWLAKLTEKGLLQPSFVPPAPIRELRDYTRMRVDLTRERTRYWQRLEKLLEDSLIKVSSVASTLATISTRDMIEALIAGERDPHVLARLARGKMKAKHHDLVQALTGRFDAHHGELARMILDQIDTLTGQINKLGTRIEQLIDALPGPSTPRRRRWWSSRRGGNECGGTAGRDPRDQHRDRAGHRGRDRDGHEHLRHVRPPGVLGQVVPPDHPVRAPQPRREDWQGQPLPQGSAGQRRGRGDQKPELLRRPLPAPGQTPGQTQSARRRRPVDPGHCLAAAGRPHRPLPRA